MAACTVADTEWVIAESHSKQVLYNLGDINQGLERLVVLHNKRDFFLSGYKFQFDPIAS